MSLLNLPLILQPLSQATRRTNVLNSSRSERKYTHKCLVANQLCNLIETLAMIPTGHNTLVSPLGLT
jgi:hypothetical protein